MENKNNLYVIGFLILLAIGGGIYISKTKISQSFSTPTPEATIQSAVEGEATTSAQTKMEDKLIIEDVKVGTGDLATSGKKITVNYAGTLTDGTKFDSSYDRGTPFTFNLGAGEVIKGWDQGFDGMKVGGKRKLTIPGSLAYGKDGIPGTIPGNAALIFEVELLKVE